MVAGWAATVRAVDELSLPTDRPETPPVPTGSVLAPDPALAVADNGQILTGGVPLRIIRLSSTGAQLVAAWLNGAPVSESAPHRRLARRLLDAGIAHPVVRPRVPDDVTVVIPVKDDLAGLDRCLESLGETPSVVVDDGSTDAEAVAAVARRRGSRLVRREFCGGPGAARASGIERISTELVAFVDADVEVEPDWLHDLVGHFDDPAVVAVAPRVRSRPGSTLLARYECEHSPLDMGASSAIVGPGRALSYVPTAALIARRESIDAVGGFAHDLRFGEDVDLIWRLVEAGGVVRYDPAVEVVHDPRRSWEAWFRQRRAYGSSAAPLGRRHGSKVAPARCSPWSALAWGAVANGYPVTGLAVAAGSSAALVDKIRFLPDPARTAVRLAGLGHFHAGIGLAQASRRAWWPIAMVALSRRRLRPAVAAAFIIPPVSDWISGSRPTDLIRSVGVRIIDDLAYGLGVWEGMVRHRTLAPIRPDLIAWPGSKTVGEPGTVVEP